MNAPRSLRQQVIATARRLHERGWVANHDGNVTARATPERFVATPTARSKADIDHDNLIEVDRSGRVVAGAARAFGELDLHLAVYARRDDIGAVVHAHPPHATALACSGSRVLERPFIAEAVVSLGASVPTVPFTLPGPDAARALTPFIDEVDAVLLANHGAMAWGRDLEQAYLRLELVEHLARIAVLAQATGGVQPLPDDAVRALLVRRAKAGLGKAADKAGTLPPLAAPTAPTAAPPPAPAAADAPPPAAASARPVVACAPAPHAPVPTISPRRPDDLTRIVREELLRALKR